MHSTPVAVVTGSSSGIGHHLCLALANQTYAVVATLRNPSNASPQLKATCDVQPLDVTSDASIKTLLSYITTQYARCDVLVNNAGYGIPGTLETITVSSAKQLFDVNVWGVMRMVQAVVPLMRTAGGGVVVTVSSTSGWRGLPCNDIYAGSKFAIEGMMDSFRYSVQLDNIKVVMVNPGPTNTSFSQRFKEEMNDASRWEDLNTPRGHVLKRMTEWFVDRVNERNSQGQSSQDCASRIVEVIEREVVRRVDDGVGRSVFSNPTCAYGDSLLGDVKVCKQGNRGPVHDTWFQDSFNLAKELEAKIEEKS
eukprot:GFKZ01003956.1.p1 GENE.GFKZ01003956.1~~GFKZ01003956.1.p1  ORF type:complete len:308 (-),score=25.80 GFKZ01003956.1:980-1903(-)